MLYNIYDGDSIMKALEFPPLDNQVKFTSGSFNRMKNSCYATKLYLFRSVFCSHEEVKLG